jgi:hypothetical protein
MKAAKTEQRHERHETETHTLAIGSLAGWIASMADAASPASPKAAGLACSDFQRANRGVGC